MMMDTPIMGGGAAHAGSQMGEQAIGTGIPMTPLRESSSQPGDPKKPAVEGTSEGLTAIAQQMISGPVVYLTGSLVTPAQVRLFVEHTRTKLRARTFMVDQLDADIDKATMQMIVLKIGHSKVMQDNSGPWRDTWDVVLFLKALEEVYAVDTVDKFAQPREIWRDHAYKIGIRLKVDYTDMGKLSREFTAVLVELNTRHPIPEVVEWSVLKTLKHVFTTTTNEFKRNVTNIKFETEFEEILRNDDLYPNKSTMERFLYLCEGPIVKWERLHYDSVVRGMKRKEGRRKQENEGRVDRVQAPFDIGRGRALGGLRYPAPQARVLQPEGAPGLQQRGQVAE